MYLILPLTSYWPTTRPSLRVYTDPLPLILLRFLLMLSPIVCLIDCQPVSKQGRGPSIKNGFPPKVPCVGTCERGIRSEPPRTRTWNLEIKSLLLCQLS